MKKLTITISGGAAAGKSALQAKLARFLRIEGFSVDVQWGPDGDPGRTPLEDEGIIRKMVYDGTRVELKAEQAQRGE